MVKQCIVLDCRSKHVDRIGFFRFPTDRLLANRWCERLKNGLPADFAMKPKDTRTVCGKHFDSKWIRDTGRGKKLMIGAVPNFIESSTSSPSNAENRDHSTTVHQTHSQIINSLQKKVNRLEEKIRKLKMDPPSSLIINHRHKLRQFMDRDAYIMFDSCIKNHHRSTYGRRHSLESKKLTSRIFHKSHQAYRLIQLLFNVLLNYSHWKFFLFFHVILGTIRTWNWLPFFCFGKYTIFCLT